MNHEMISCVAVGAAVVAAGGFAATARRLSPKRESEHLIEPSDIKVAGKIGSSTRDLRRGILERSKNGIDASLITPPLSPEPFKYVRVHPQRYRGLGADRLETLTDDA